MPKTVPEIQCSRLRAVVIGVSAGGTEALPPLFTRLSKEFPLSIVVVQHLHHTQDGSFTERLNDRYDITVKEADEKEPIREGCVYFAPANYHLLIERDETFSLSIDEKVNYSRPSIDVTFESAAGVWSSRLIGIVLTGASSDGARGLCQIKERGGLTLAQDPETAAYPFMPQAAIDTGRVDRVLTLAEIGDFLKDLEPVKRGEPGAGIVARTASPL